MRAVLHRGYWLVTSLYLVTDARLTPFQLVFLGTAQGLTSVVFEIPTGVMADSVSRKWSLVISHVLMGASMLITGLVTTFPALVATQMLWGLAWTFASGAEVAWLTDELGQPDRIAAVLAIRARMDQIGALLGMVAFGVLAWAISRSIAMVGAGASMMALGIYVVARFTEIHFTPSPTHRWRHSVMIFHEGFRLARRDHEILLVLVATFLVNGAAEAYGRLFPKRLIQIGLPQSPDPVVWFTALGILTYAVGAIALRIVERHMDPMGGESRFYTAACFIGAIGLILLACAPNAFGGGAGVLLVGGIALTVTRTAGEIWVNRRTASNVRATVHSFLGQVEYLGEIACGVTLGLIAQSTSISAALACSGVLIVCAGALVFRSQARHS